MRQIIKDISMNIDGSPTSFRLTKPDAFSGVEILRLLLRLQDARPEENTTDANGIPAHSVAAVIYGGNGPAVARVISHVRGSFLMRGGDPLTALGKTEEPSLCLKVNMD